ncbi:hypothetical protein DPMN_112703 [Dreissena polymorpha]|uniref:EGF-like domain-containing protein n=1 Tax=Dreissena polymorpha TaxID=45954 RepID=A0A9D4KHB7_DREPO|nr:hypothetical protein DPMN_112703 [Dreissena polymorpha]
MLDFVLVVCSLCSGHGSCNTSMLREGQENPKYKLATCECEPYWTGDDCQSEFDGCEANPCSFGRNCTDRNASEHKANTSLTAYSCSPCPIGFGDTNDKCEDIDECKNSPCGANSQCVNTEGNYFCVCNGGYRLSSTNKSWCDDINECEESTSDCDQICNNTSGSFTCSCHYSYTYNSKSKTCEQDSPPVVCVGKCSGTDGCMDNNGVAECFCKAGYRLNVETIRCDDIDECNTTKPCSHKCHNIVGSYRCSCYDGYALDVDKITCEVCQFPYYGAQCSKTCQCGAGSEFCDSVRGCVCKTGWTGTNCATDIDECDTPNKCRSPDKVCSNSIGSYSCNCRSGFEKKHDTCEDIDECAMLGLNTCSYLVDPTDATQCKDVNECAAGISGCQHMCLNSVGRFSCACYFGFELQEDRKQCALTHDVCKKEFPYNGCSQICRADLQTKTYKCLCNTGYKLGADNKTCIDINECADLMLNKCSQTCENTAGGYTCTCKTGFKLANDLRTCDACDDFFFGDKCATACDCAVGADRCDSVTGCLCKPGWSGSKCNIDQDECADDNRCPGSNMMCTNTPGLYQCGCETGFKKAGKNCVDIDECLEYNDCEQICTNTNGSYECNCNSGYVQNGKECTDIDECSNGRAGCVQVCTNTDGGFRCSCNEFYLLADNKNACLPQQECTSQNYCKNGICAVIHAQQTCTCNSGFRFQSGSHTVCEDIKECATNPCTQTCLEKEGSYECGCNQLGYKLAVDKKTCIKCREGHFGPNCTQDCACVKANTETCAFETGECTCLAGWQGTKCDLDKKECTAVTSPCPANSACVETPGSYVCKCDAGYIKSGDGTCQVCPSWKYGAGCAIDCECNTSNSLSCSNTFGTCSCKKGWEGNDCATDTDECTGNTTICGDTLKTCENVPGSYRCECRAGYTLIDGVCKDKDECLESTNNCIQKCTNTDGSFECGCEPGYSGIGNNCVEDGVLISIKIHIPEEKVRYLNFSVKATFDQWAATLSASIMAYYSNTMSSKLKKVIIQSIQISGSLDVNATIVKEDSVEASRIFAQATHNLNSATLVLDNGTYALKLLAVRGVPIDSTQSANDEMCAIYLSDRGQCDNNYACEVVDGKPLCEPVNADDDLGLVLGLGIGIPLFLITCVFVAVIIVYAVRNRRKKFSYNYERNSFRNGFFTRGMPVKITTWGMNDPMYKQHSQREPFFSSTLPIDDQRRRRHRDVDYAAQGNYVYDDNQQQSNFSWDFLTKYISPEEPFKIQRPRTDRSPHPAYDS